MVSAKLKQIDLKRFHHITGQLFADQYYHIYNARLKFARKTLIENSRFRWGEDVKNIPLEELNASLGSTDVFVIGTLFKLMPNQPSILRELEGTDLSPSDPKVNFTSDQDSLILHETDENVKVVGDIDIHSHVTGIPVSLFGHQLNGGASFHVSDICYAGPSLSVYKMPKANMYDDSPLKNKRLLIISGLEFGFDSTLGREKTLEIINALKALRELVLSDKTKGYEIVKMIIAGNSIGPNYMRAEDDSGDQTSESEGNKDGRSLSEVFGLFDNYLYTLASDGRVEIDVMPGKNDPASFLLPQQPFHPKILPKSGQLKNVNPTTNPCLMEYEDHLILGTSGENVDAIRQYTNIEFSTTIIKNTLEWSHIAPSAPDNLSCVPFKEKDPFIIDFVPDIYFAGNQPEFAVTTYSTETKHKIQIISVPKFLESRSCVTLDLGDLETELLTF